MRQAVVAGRSLKHVQVREYVRELVAQAMPGDTAPSERSLVQQFGVSRMTVRQALDSLVAEGLLVRLPGRGTFVARPRRGSSPVLGFSEEMDRRGLYPSSETLLVRSEPARPGIARALGVAEGVDLVHWRRLRRGDGVPICIEDVFLDASLVPGMLDKPLPASLYADLEARDLRPSWVEDSFSADAATLEEASLLDLGSGVPVLRRQRRALAGERFVEVCRSVYRSDRYTLRLQLGPQPA